MPGLTIPSLFRRTLLYLALLAGFYALALGLAMALVALPFVLHRIGPTGEFAVLEEFRALDLGRRDAGPWVKRCGELGIADWPLDITEP